MDKIQKPKNTTISEERWVEEGEGVVNELAGSNVVVHILCRGIHLPPSKEWGSYSNGPLQHSTKPDVLKLIYWITNMQFGPKEISKANQKIPNYRLGQLVPVKLLTAIQQRADDCFSQPGHVRLLTHCLLHWVSDLTGDCYIQGLQDTHSKWMIDIKCESSPEHRVSPSIVEMWLSPDRSHTVTVHSVETCQQ